MNIIAAFFLFVAFVGPAVSQVVDICPSFCIPNPNGFVEAIEQCNVPSRLNLCQVEDCFSFDDGSPGFSCTVPQNSFIVSNSVFDTESADLVVDYSWGPEQTDLDSATAFLDNVSGNACDLPGPFMVFGGDNTGNGGTEFTIVDIELARQQSFWTDSTSVTARADWFGEANQGPATLTVYLKDRATASPIPGTQLSMLINPGAGTGCAVTPVGIVFIDRGQFATRVALSTLL